MTYSKDIETGTATLALSREETRFFENGHPVTELTYARSGIVKMELTKKVACPNATTRAFLRGLVSEGKARPAMDVVDVLPLLKEHHGMIEADLRRFIARIGKDVPLADIMAG